MQATTMRGKTIDMGKLIAMNSHKRALGNAKMNARGDIIDANGSITAARETVARDYHKANPKAVKQVSLRNISQEVMSFDSPAQALAKHKELQSHEMKKRKLAE